jgi:hypothetical protein
MKVRSAPIRIMLRIVIRRASLFALTLLTLAGCGPETQTKQRPVADPNGPGPATAISKNPLTKYIELSGFRLTEGGPGKLKVQFAAINHSEGDLGNVTVKVKLVTTASKPEEPPVAEFQADIKDLGPLAIRNAETTAATKMRSYELPDWQFLRAQFDVVSPAP